MQQRSGPGYGNWCIGTTGFENQCRLVKNSQIAYRLECKIYLAYGLPTGMLGKINLALRFSPNLTALVLKTRRLRFLQAIIAQVTKHRGRDFKSRPTQAFHKNNKPIAGETSMNQIFTIGYEGASIEDFISILKTHRVTTLLDVREIPLSRRKGYSKNSLAQALRSSGIEYRHERNLGSPKTIRDTLHNDKDYAKFFNHFEQHLQTQQSLLNSLSAELDGNIVLMCYERDPKTCHRILVAEHFNNLTGSPVTHLSVTKHGNQSKKASIYTGQGISPTQPTI